MRRPRLWATKRSASLGLGARDAVEAGVLAADAGADAGLELAGALAGLVLELGHELPGIVGAGGPENDQSARVGGVHQRTPGQLERRRHLRQRLAAPLAVAIADQQFADDRDVPSGRERSVEGQSLALQLQLGVEVV